MNIILNLKEEDDYSYSMIVCFSYLPNLTTTKIYYTIKFLKF